MKNQRFSIVYSISNTNAPYRLLYVYKIKEKKIDNKTTKRFITARKKRNAVNEHKQNNVAQQNTFSTHFLSLCPWIPQLN